MIVAQTTSHTFPSRDRTTDVQIALTVQLSSPGDVGVDVAFDAFLEEALQAVFNQCLFDAIHGGIAAVQQPLPQQGVKIDVVVFSLTPETALVQEGKLNNDVLRISEWLLSTIVSNLFYTLLIMNASAKPAKKAARKKTA